MENKMPTKDEIENIKKIMEESKRFAKTPEQLEELNRIIKGFTDASERYLKNKECEMI
jgi:hypothetical protein